MGRFTGETSEEDQARWDQVNAWYNLHKDSMELKRLNKWLPLVKINENQLR